MQTHSRNIFLTIHTEGALLPADLLQRILAGDKGLDGLTPDSYHLPPGEKLNEAINRAWNRLQGAWAAFQTSRGRLKEGDPGTTLTRERWLLPLFQELSYGRLQTAKAIEIEGKSYPISHTWGTAELPTPIHLVGCGVDIEKRQAGVSGASKASPHSLMQELLNRDESRHWGLVSNGLRLRVLRDNASLTRQAYLEFDLEALFSGEIYADFAVLWLVCHQSRLEGDKPEAQWLERWASIAQEQGTRALEGLRSGVKEAIIALGQGFLAHPANQALRQKLKSGKLSRQQYFRQLLRLVYRLIFLFVAEERDLLLLPEAGPTERQRYLKYYSTARLRRLAERQRGGRHPDLWQAVRLLTDLLAGKTPGGRELGLPVLGGFLFSHAALPDLEDAQVDNQALLNAVRKLAFSQEKSIRRVDYKNLGSEELGSVYESLLELQPLLNVEAGTFQLTTTAGNERKTTGSYYTAAALIKITLDSALDPVIAQAILRAGSSIEMQIAALLALKICDPACGSGHFLIAAARRLARRIAQLRSGDEEPSPSEIRHALREVIAHCIYGVDLNPMAVELCKVNLWLEALEPGKPLTFLDAHIKCGNSLVGVGPGMDVYDLVIPNEAFDPVTGDDKKVAAALKRRNKEERKGQLTFDLSGVKEEPVEDYVSRIRQVEAMPEDMPEQVIAKESAYQNFQNEYRTQHRHLLASLWTAAFFWRLQPPDTNGALDAPTQGEWCNARLNKPSVVLTVQAQRLGEENNFFHWPLEFPDVFEQGGFDCILGNPPWERIKLQEEEFFAARDPEIAAAPNKAARQRLIDVLSLSNPALAIDFQEVKHAAEATSKFVRASGRFPMTAVGDVNTYALFAEHSRMLLAHHGHTGIIVPTGIATDDTTKAFFGDLMSRQSLAQLVGFENETFIFQGVHHAFKFCMVNIMGEKDKVASSSFVFFCRSAEQTHQPIRRFQLTRREISLINPNTHTVPIFRTRIDADLTTKIYQRTPVLVNENDSTNNWGISYRQGLFHSSNDAFLFGKNSYAALVNNGGKIKGNTFVVGDTVYLPYIEGKMIHIYDHRFATYANATQANLNVGILPQTTTVDKSDPNFCTIPRYWVKKCDVEERFKNQGRNWVIGFRDITGVGLERTATVTILPLVGISDQIGLLFSISESSSLPIACLLGNFNALVLDYVVRQKLGSNHLKKYAVYQLPFLAPTFYTPTDVAYITPRVLELVYTAYDLRPFAEDMGYTGEPFRWDDGHRAMLRAELDAYYAKLYSLTRDELRYILDPQDVYGSNFPGETFRVLKEKEIKIYGEYRTGRLVLEAWDKLESIEAHGWIVDQTSTADHLVLDSMPREVKSELKSAIIEPELIENERRSELEITWIPIMSEVVEAEKLSANFRQAVGVAWLLENFGTGKYIPLFDIQKYSYFVQRKGLANLGVAYKEYARGPYSPQMTYQAGGYAKKKSYWEHLGQNIARRPKIKEAINAASRIFTDIEQAKQLVEQLVILSKDDLGGLATVDFASRAIFELGQDITPENIRAYFKSSWKEKEHDLWYTDENILWAFEFLNKMGLLKKIEEKKVAKKKKITSITADIFQPTFSEFELYKCSACGKTVMGFDRENHVREVHKGMGVEWRKVK